MPTAYLAAHCLLSLLQQNPDYPNRSIGRALPRHSCCPPSPVAGAVLYQRATNTKGKNDIYCTPISPLLMQPLAHCLHDTRAYCLPRCSLPPVVTAAKPRLPQSIDRPRAASPQLLPAFRRCGCLRRLAAANLNHPPAPSPRHIELRKTLYPA